MSGRHRLTGPSDGADARRALLHLSVPPFRTSTGWAYPYLMVRNDGPATAVDVELAFHPLDTAPGAIRDTTTGGAEADDPGSTPPSAAQAAPAPAAEQDSMSERPALAPPTFVEGEPAMTTLGCAEVVSFGISPPWAEPVRWEVELRWTDGGGSHVDRRVVSKQAPG